MKNYTHTAFEILDMMYYINVATCDDKMVPWNSIVYWAFDRDLNIFWSSAVDAVCIRRISRYIHMYFLPFMILQHLSVYFGNRVFTSKRMQESWLIPRKLHMLVRSLNLEKEKNHEKTLLNLPGWHAEESIRQPLKKYG